jgi:hypothetical protein
MVTAFRMKVTTNVCVAITFHPNVIGNPLSLVTFSRELIATHNP